jgi:hypothetical protein
VRGRCGHEVFATACGSKVGNSTPPDPALPGGANVCRASGAFPKTPSELARFLVRYSQDFLDAVPVGDFARAAAFSGEPFVEVVELHTVLEAPASVRWSELRRGKGEGVWDYNEDQCRAEGRGATFTSETCRAYGAWNFAN